MMTKIKLAIGDLVRHMLTLSVLMLMYYGVVHLGLSPELATIFTVSMAIGIDSY